MSLGPPSDAMRQLRPRIPPGPQQDSPTLPTACPLQESTRHPVPALHRTLKSYFQKQCVLKCLFQKILYSLNNISIIYNMIQKYRYTSLHYLIKRFTIFFSFTKRTSIIIPWKHNVTFRLKLHHLFGWDVVRWTPQIHTSGEETSQNSLLNENAFLRLPTLKFLSSQVMKTNHTVHKKLRKAWNAKCPSPAQGSPWLRPHGEAAPWTVLLLKAVLAEGCRRRVRRQDWQAAGQCPTRPRNCPGAASRRLPPWGRWGPPGSGGPASTRIVSACSGAQPVAGTVTGLVCQPWAPRAPPQRRGRGLPPAPTTQRVLSCGKTSGCFNHCWRTRAGLETDGAASLHKKPLPSQADPEDPGGPRPHGLRDAVAVPARPRRQRPRPASVSSWRGRQARGEQRGPGCSQLQGLRSIFRLAGGGTVRRHSAGAQKRSRDPLSSARVFHFLQSYVHVISVILL